MGDEIVKTTTAATTLPEWMQQALFNTIQAGQMWASQPYQPYNTQAAAGGLDAARNMVGGPGSMTQQAWQQAQASQGAWKPTMNAATQGMATLLQTPGATQSASPYMNQQNQMLGGMNYNAGVQSLSPFVQQSANYNPMVASLPYMDAASAQATAAGAAQTAPQLQQAQQGWLNQGLAQGAPQQGADLTAQSAAERAMAYANPYMQSAGQTSVQNIDSYMNPYNRNVTDEIARLGTRNLSENLLPATSDAFVKAGSFGGTRMGEFGSRAVRDTQESILGQQAQALQQGYGQGMQASQADLARQAQLAGTAGQIAGADLSRMTQAGGQLATIGQQQQQMGLGATTANQAAQQADLQRMLQSGQLQANMGQTVGAMANSQQDALLKGGSALAAAQQNAISQGLAGAGQYGQMGQLAGNLTQTDLARQQSGLGQMANFGQMGQQLGAADIGMLSGAGTQQDQHQQNLLNTAYNQWQQQQQFPQQNIGWMAGLLSGTPTQNTVNTTANTGMYNPSTFDEWLSNFASGASIYSDLTKK